MTTLTALTEQATEFGRETKDTIEEMGRTAGKKLDNARDDTGSALHTAASSVRATGRKSSDAIGKLTAGAADRLDATASYVEHNDLRGMVRKFSLKHLTGSLVAVAAVGFLAGSAFSRATHSCARAASR